MVLRFLSVTFVGLLLTVSSAANAQKKKRRKPDLTIFKSVNVPLKEVSGLGLFEELSGEEYLIYAVGDASAQAHVSTWQKTTQVGPKRIMDFQPAFLERFSPCLDLGSKWCKDVAKSVSGDWEAVQVDGKRRVYFLQEMSGLVFVTDADGYFVRAINLDFSGALASHESKTQLKDPPATHRAEGFVLMQKGRLLVLHQKNPTKLIEFGPPNTDSLGINEDSFLSRVESFDLPPENDGKIVYKASKSWGFNGLGKGCDLNELTYDTRRKSLLVLSKKCKEVIELKKVLGTDSQEQIMVKKRYRLPRQIRSPEGLVSLPNGMWMVASESNKIKRKNLFILKLRKDT